MEFTENGITVRTIEEVTADNTDLWSEKTGDFDVSPSSAGGELIAIKSENDARFEQNLADAYTQNTILATGTYLEMVGQRQGKYRRTNVPTVVIVTITGSEGDVINEGTTLKCSTNDEIFETQYAITLPAGGELQVTVGSQNYGVICPANTLSFDPAIPGITVSNASSGVIGFKEESDEDFRNRLSSFGTSKTNSKDGLYFALLNVVGVAKARVIDNNTDSALYVDIPARHFACVLYGGNTGNIAQTIYNFMQNGNPSYGNISQIIKSVRGQLYGVSFTRASELSVNIAVTITTDSDFDTATGNGVITQNIINLFDALEIGEKVFIDKVKSECWIDGVTSVSLTLNGGASNINTDWFEIATTNASLVTIS